MAAISGPEFSSRRLNTKPFQGDTEPHWWFGNQSSTTEFLHALSILFPEGEAFFVRSVNYYGERVRSIPNLAAEVKAFSVQEAHHAGEHSWYNREIGMRYNHDQEKVNAFVKSVLSFTERIPHILLPRVTCLAVTCSLEHLTSILAHILLATEAGRWTLKQMSPSHRFIWVWHAIEETEHKGVAYDVYVAIGGGYFHRVWNHILATGIFLVVVFYIHASYLWDSGLLLSFAAHQQIWYFLLVYPGFLRTLVPLWLEYFRPGFHPWQHDNRHIIDKWSKLVAEKTLEEQHIDSMAFTS